MPFFEQHLRAQGAALKKLALEPLGTLITAVVIALSLAIPATLYRLAQTTQALIADDAHRPSVLVVLKDGLTDEQLKALKDSLVSRSDIQQVQIISPANGLQALQARLGRQDLLAGLDQNPLPTVITVQPKALNAETFDQLTEALRASPGVDHLKTDADWAKRLQAILRFVDGGVLILGAILLIAALTVVVNTVRLQVAKGQEEIRVSKLIGASDAFVRRPFVYLGIFEMSAGSALALALTALAQRGFNALSVQWLAPLDLHFLMPPIVAPDLLLAFGGAILLGGLCASLTVTFSLGRSSRGV